MVELLEPYKWWVNVRFLVKEAPHDWLNKYPDFELYEGKKWRAAAALSRASTQPPSSGFQTATLFKASAGSPWGYPRHTTRGRMAWFPAHDGV